MFSYNKLDNFEQDEPLTQNHNPLLNEREAAALLGVTTRCLQAWRYRGGGPQFVKISARCNRPSDLHEFIDTRLRASTSDAGEGGAA